MKRQPISFLSSPLGAPLGVLWCLVAGCAYVPARFSASDAVTFVHDDYPVPVPGRTAVPDEIRYSEAYVERAVVDGLDPRRTVDSEDVNALDEVPTSSWFSGRLQPDYDAFYQSGPPSLPLKEIARDPSLPKGVRVFVDTQARRWEIVPDEKYRSGMRVAAGTIASRLVSALGYYVAETYPIRLEGERVLAVRFPATRGALSGQDAIELGPTASLGTRLDDPNDVIDHEHRRSLRALRLVAAWIGLDEYRANTLRDVYVGVPNIGFVQHQIVGLEDALGAGKVIRILHHTDYEGPVGNVWLALGTFGFGPKEKADPSATPTASVGLFPAALAPASYRLAVPFPAAIEAQPADLYWIGKRIAGVTRSRIGEAVSAGELEPKANEYLEASLVARRDAVARYGMSLVTPLEVTRVAMVGARVPAKGKAPLPMEAPVGSLQLDLDDLAIRRGFERAATTRYEVDVFDERGGRLEATQTSSPRGSSLRLYFPSKVLDETGYVILRIRSYRDGSGAPRPVELHLRGTSEKPVLRGVRH